MERPMSEYAADAPRILRDFLTYISTIQGKSARTAHEYYLDLRLFLRVLKHNKGLVPRELPIDRIAIDDIDIDFLKTVTLSDAYDYLEYMAQSRPTQQNSNHTNYGLSVNSRARKVSAIRAFFRYLTDKQHVLEVNPVSGLEAPTVRKSLPTSRTIPCACSVRAASRGRYFSMMRVLPRSNSICPNAWSRTSRTRTRCLSAKSATVLTYRRSSGW